MQYEFAAVPSGHVVFALVVAPSIWEHARSRSSRSMMSISDPGAQRHKVVDGRRLQRAGCLEGRIGPGRQRRSRLRPNTVLVRISVARAIGVRTETRPRALTGAEPCCSVDSEVTRW